MTRLQTVWVAIVAFLPLYGVVGSVLVERPDAAADRPRFLYGVLAFVFAVLAVVLRPLLRRAGLHPDPAHMVAWAAAEAVAIVGLVAWVESGDVRPYFVYASAAFLLMVGLRPRTPDVPSQQR